MENQLENQSYTKYEQLNYLRKSKKGSRYTAIKPASNIYRHRDKPRFQTKAMQNIKQNQNAETKDGKMREVKNKIHGFYFNL